MVRKKLHGKNRIFRMTAQLINGFSQLLLVRRAAAVLGEEEKKGGFTAFQLAGQCFVIGFQVIMVIRRQAAFLLQETDIFLITGGKLCRDQDIMAFGENACRVLITNLFRRSE